MTGAFDDRLVNLEIEVDGQKHVYDQSYYIIAEGTRFTNGNFGTCNLRIDNISKKFRDYLIGRTSQWVKNKTVANVRLNVGRESYGTFMMFAGQAMAGSPTQPPNIGLILNSLTGLSQLGFDTSIASPENSTVEDICKQVAKNAGVNLSFKAQNNPVIGNYQFAGVIGKQIKGLSDLGVYAYQDTDGTLVVTDVQVARDLPVIDVSQETGMVGVPQITQNGVRVNMLIKNEIKIGAPVQLTSKVNPTVNGKYMIYKLGFQLGSRENPFYWVLDLRPIDFALG